MSSPKLKPDDTARRLDIWLWFARFFKSRTLATRFVQSGRLRINKKVVKKAHYNVRVGDILTFPKLDYIKVVQVLSLGVRRGPASEARELYLDISKKEASVIETSTSREHTLGMRAPGSGRPTKRQRRAIEQLRAG